MECMGFCDALQFTTSDWVQSLLKSPVCLEAHNYLLVGPTHQKLEVFSSQDLILPIDNLF